MRYVLRDTTCPSDNISDVSSASTTRYAPLWTDICTQMCHSLITGGVYRSIRRSGKSCFSFGEWLGSGVASRDGADKSDREHEAGETQEGE